METIVKYILNQHPTMIVLFVLSVICWAAALDRLLFWLASAARYSPMPPEIYRNDDSLKQILVEQLKGKKRRHYLEDIILGCMERQGSDEYLAQIISEKVDAMSSHIGMLDLVAKLGPLVGILGTVMGMSMSFAGAGGAAMTSPATISKGISIALQTTIYGLIISITASVTCAAFRKCIRNAVLKMEGLICEIQCSQKTNSV
jgi:biopolymer transport protein ExbB/TolQ